MIAASFALSACSGGGGALPVQSSNERHLTPQSVAAGQSTATFQAALVMPASAGSAALGIAHWSYYIWNDQKSISVVGASASGAPVWEMDSTGDSTGAGGSLSTSDGMYVTRTAGGAVVVHSRGAQNGAQASRFATAARTDASAYTGYTPSTPHGGGGAGPKQAAHQRSVRFIKPTDSLDAFAVYVDAASFSWDAAVLVGAVAAGAAITAEIWVPVALGALALSVTVYAYNKAVNAPPPPPNGCTARCYGGTTGGTTPEGPIGPPVMLPPNTSGVTRVCVGAADGSFMECTYHLYTN